MPTGDKANAKTRGGTEAAGESENEDTLVQEQASESNEKAAGSLDDSNVNEGEEGEEADAETEEKSPSKARTSRRGGKRSRKRKGGRQTKKAAVVVTEDDNTASDDVQMKEEAKVVSPDEAEIEITSKRPSEDVEMKEEVDDGAKTEDTNDESADDSEPKREPSPVVTRRSNRKLKQQKSVEKESQAQLSTEETGNSNGGGGAGGGVDPSDRFEVESVTSEVETASVTSGSTLTTRSNRKKKNGGGGGKGEANGSVNGTAEAGGSAQSASSKKETKKTASKSSNSNRNTANHSNSAKGKSRRIIFKKSATKAPTAVAKAVTSDRVFHRGQYFTRGDIVSMIDWESGGVYYAQLRGFLTDQYCEKSGVITWLLPTANSPDPAEGFDPSTYVIGPEEDLPRKLDYMTFVMHAPDDYFYYRNAPYPTTAIETNQEYVLTRQGPRVRLIKTGTNKVIYQDA